MHDIKSKLQEFFNVGDNVGSKRFLIDILNNSKLDNNTKAEVLYYLGRILFYEKSYSEAKIYFSDALKLSNNHVSSRIYLGLIAEELGQNEYASRIYASCIKTNSEYKQLKERIAKLALKFEQKDDGIGEILNKIESKKEVENKFPLVTIIILCYNKLEYTKKCLESVFSKTSYSNYEIVVVDNGSVDDTSTYLESWGDKIKFCHSNKNLGFVGGNNFGAELGEGKYFLFLNNDTEVTKNWLKQLYNTFVMYPDSGAVGSMLVYPNGKLQEAGGIIFNDASGWNYGKDGSIHDSRFNYLREVDYCSGAALMVKKDLFNKHGGFDNRFAPAYYEDTDLCFGIRKLGYKVYYCPLSKVIHHEGVTAGTDLSKGFKKYQELNTPKFIDKWKSELKKQYPADPKHVYQFSNRMKGKRILIFDDIPPFPDRAAGALRHYHTLKQMLKLGYKVTYVHLMGGKYNDESGIKYFNEFKMQGVEFFWFNYESWWNYRETPEVQDTIKELVEKLDLELRNFDLVYIAFWYIAKYFVKFIRQQIPSVPILVDTMDLHYLRETRQAEIAKDPKLLLQAKETKKNELEIYSQVDCITTVTENDRNVLKEELPNKSILILTDVHDAKKTKTKFEERKDFLFIGNFNHNPNEDAVIYFVNQIFPLIKKELPEAKFKIVGNNPTEKIKSLECDDIIVTGWVPEVKPYLEECKVSVVPLRFGAGNKGKVGETLSHGLPMVSTTVGAEGMSIVNEVHSFVADDSKKFADYCIKLYTEKNIWENFSSLGKELISSQYSSSLMKKRLEYIMSFNSRKKFKSSKALSFSSPPQISIIIVTYNQKKYTLECIESIKKFTTINYEIIIVDNNSKDNTVNEIAKKWTDIKIIENSDNYGFPKAVNQGIISSIGDYVLLLNNDTVVTAGWLENLKSVADKDPHIGIVGPISNSVSGIQLDKDASYSSISDMHKYAEDISIKNKEIYHDFPRVAFLCTLIKKEVIDKIGGLDERFSPGNFEDDDFCLRSQLAGFKTVIAKDTFIHHYGSVSFKSSGESKYSERLRLNEEKFSDKWGSNPEGIWLKNVKYKERSIMFPIERDSYNQSIARAFINIDDEEYDYALSNIQLALEDFDNSKRIGYENISKEELLNIGGNISLAKNELDEAKQYFELELQNNPTSSSACIGLGDVLYKAELLNDSKTMFEWAVINDNSNSNALSRLKNINKILNFSENHNSVLIDVNEEQNQ